ncbi:hypothetical protein AMJ85_08580 [candidate division BRC1 bacterium SM23_51]|nr:MAG: hypothetical protein AMJ85_08580 [candidate division BRC1 bacterium SM23_51]
MGPAGHAVWLHSLGNVLRCGPLDGLRSAKALTVELWVRASTPLNGSLDLHCAGGPQPGIDFAFSLTKDGHLSGAFREKNSWFGVPSVFQPQPGVWQHIAIVCDDQSISAYVNGRAAGNTAGGLAGLLHGRPLAIFVTADQISEPFSIELDELRVWSVARNAKQIRNAMNRTVAPIERGLVGYWRFDEGGGQIARDLSLSAAHAQLGETVMPDGSDPLWLVSDVPLTRTATEKPARSAEQGSALEFDGTDDYVDMGNAPELRIANAVTVEAWIKPAIVKGERPILSKEVARGRQNAFELLVRDGHLGFRVSDGTAGCCGDQGWFPATGKTPIEPGFWHHAAGVYDGQQVSVYLDGVLEGSVAFENPIAHVPTSVKLGINSLVSSKFFAGQMDEVRLWNRARSQSEIFDSMNRLLRGNEPGLVGYWTFDEAANAAASSATCQVVFDHSRHNNHGVLGGSMARDSKDPRPVISEAPVAPTTESWGAKEAQASVGRTAQSRPLLRLWTSLSVWQRIYSP